ncbi:hypothetical protein A676_04369 [Salmonella enterica subsp. enterica serovar Enteritidis str. 2010K-0262]|uniref:Uncharacterized protein n=1 Tax=Salmonella enteritidis (strain 2009K0958) TaxID=1192586 RepID=A0A656IBK4_SALE2|nr:hypothetical protein SPUL_0647 [Salmonella enterica subsp. enterica serovar Gallinarum/Pullorum str. RKS5078]AGU63562.1 hypothetical protein SPUCDC_0647 [Salmonella enterica subsp. enterica serovar Gallinarum/Pullorum str. CDC1983-67]ATD43778.1 hypothetical protein FORC51_1560 [Salmonella enterica]EPI63921.1 hypothetical protein A673_04526 [Salmonella enterica subsp. enterica serovar Enteritidis str. 2009K0958]EPI64722.1 hypothetical protein A672_04395 [Salmonella enterica subsp. enterica se
MAQQHMPHFCYVTLSEKSVQTSIQLQGVFCFLSQRVVLSFLSFS